MKIMEQFLKPPGKLLFLLRLKQQKIISEISQKMYESGSFCAAAPERTGNIRR